MQVMSGYKMLQDFVRRFVAAGGKIHSGSDPNHVCPAMRFTQSLRCSSKPVLRLSRLFKPPAINVAQAWGKDKDYGSVEKGKIADLSSSAATRTKIFPPRRMWRWFYRGKSRRHLVSSGL